MEKGLRRLMCAAGLLGIAAFVLTLLFFVLFLVGTNHWQQPLGEDVAPAALALVVIYAVCVAVAMVLLPLSCVCLGMGICQVRAAAKGELRRRSCAVAVVGLVFAAVSAAVMLFFLFMFGSLGSLQVWREEAFAAVTLLGAALSALCVAAVVVQAICIARLRRARKAQQMQVEAYFTQPPPYAGPNF